MTLPIVIYQFPAVIAAGASLSGPVSLGYCSLAAISMPSVWTPASLTFQVSPDGGVTWQELYLDTGVEVAVTASASQYITISDRYVWAPINMIQVRSGTLATPVVQAAGASLTLIAGPWNF